MNGEKYDVKWLLRQLQEKHKSTEKAYLGHAHAGNAKDAAYFRTRMGQLESLIEKVRKLK